MPSSQNQNAETRIPTLHPNLEKNAAPPEPGHRPSGREHPAPENEAEDHEQDSLRRETKRRDDRVRHQAASRAIARNSQGQREWSTIAAEKSEPEEKADIRAHRAGA